MKEIEDRILIVGSDNAQKQSVYTTMLAFLSRMLVADPEVDYGYVPCPTSPDLEVFIVFLIIRKFGKFLFRGLLNLIAELNEYNNYRYLFDVILKFA